MKVYQCFHKYSPHINYFEERYKPIENNLSFKEWRNLLIKDGFASCNILQPAIEGKSEEVFYSMWDYENLQFKWASENGLKTRNLDEIKLAQIEEYNPDVFYNFSPYYDGEFIRKIPDNKMIKICWDSIITRRPAFHEKYDFRFSLFEPFVKYWNQHGFKSYILSPAFVNSWNELNRKQKDIDILFYGQFQNYFFSDRNSILVELAKWSKQKGYVFNFHLQLPNSRRPLINKKGLRKWTRWMPVAPKIIMDNSLSPIYGRQLYETIARSRIVINGFGNFNGLYKENMRNYESIGCGAFLISEDGIYPEHFVQNKDFLTYRNTSELFDKIEQILTLQDKGLEWTERSWNKLKKVYSKEKQWNSFVEAVNSIHLRSI